MGIQDAKALKGKYISLTWIDRNGRSTTEAVNVLDVAFVPFYGPSLVCSTGDYALVKVTGYKIIESVAA